MLITVAQSSIGNSANKHGGSKHDQWPSGTSKPSPNVFNPSYNYPANEKKWGDIIPPTDVSGNPLGGNLSSVNYSGAGIAIYNGTGAYAGICKAMSARDFYESEIAAGETSADTLTDLTEQEADENANALSACGGSFTGRNPTSLGQPTLPVVTTTTVASTTTNAPTTSVIQSSTTTVVRATTTTVATVGTLPPGFTLASGKGALQGRVWIDKNRDHSKGSDEKYLAGITVAAKGPDGQTLTATTDANGFYIFNDVVPGDWTVVAQLSIESLEKVYDSTGAADWQTTATVAAGEVVAQKFAAAPVATSSSLPTTGSSGTALLTALALVLFASGVLVLGLDRRK